MTRISLIAAIDQNHGLGKNNQLLCHLPADLAHFKQLTLGKPIIMGRKTYESIGRPLPGRKNIVLSRQVLSIDGVTVVHSLQQALDCVADAPEIMIIGGSTLFEEAMPIAQCIYLTKIDHQFEADVFFPQLEKSAWHSSVLSYYPQDEKNQYGMTFFQYERKRS